MASPEAESLMELLRPYVHSRILQEVVEKLDSQMCTLPMLLRVSESTLKLLLDKFVPKASLVVTTRILSAIQARKEDLRHEGEPLLKKAKRSAEEHLSSEDLFHAEKSYFEKLLEPPSELPESADDLMKFLSLKPVSLPTRSKLIFKSVRDHKLVVLDTSAPMDALASFSDATVRSMVGAPDNELTNSHELCNITANFLKNLNGLAPVNRRLQSLRYRLDAANPTTTNRAS